VGKLYGVNKNYIELEGSIIVKTEKAILFSDGLGEVWIPLSQLEDDPDKQANGLFKIVIPEWLAIEKELV
jgi:hypothetical protein